MSEIYPVNKANEIKLKRQVHSGAFLVVEGRDDRLFMQRFTSTNECKIEVGQGKYNVRKIVELLEKENFRGIIGLIDADFDRIDTQQSSSINSVMPQYHDLETMLICSSALDRVLIELGSQDKLDKFEENVLDALIDRALPIGYLRLHSWKNALNLQFEGINYSAWIDRRTFQVSIARLINEVKNNSQRQGIPSDLLENSIRELEDSRHDPREICNGTDLTEILSIGLKRRLGNGNDSTVNAAVLRQSLRLAYSDQDFWASPLREAISNWEDQAAGFQILRR